MKVLTIDLDYFMGSVIGLYEKLHVDEHPILRWQDFFDETEFRESDFFIDKGSLLYCYSVFLKSLKNNPTVSFGYDHDSILYGIKEYSNIDLINIDHHDDIVSEDFDDDSEDGYERGTNSYDGLWKEYYCASKLNRVHEGNWVSWLHSEGKLNSYTWIHNVTSNLQRNEFNVELLDEKYNCFLKEDYKFTNYNFDYVFVCLSPAYIPPTHWHYFSMFMKAYKEITDKEINLIDNRSHEFELRYIDMTNALLY